jgi:hypothetical protein
VVFLTIKALKNRASFYSELEEEASLGGGEKNLLKIRRQKNLGVLHS